MAEPSTEGMNLRTQATSYDASRGNSPKDVGTLWTMRRSGHCVRCALLARSDEWELRVLVDGETLLAERRPRGAEAFRLGELWKDRMLEQGWEPVIPTRAIR